jgi:hypothetical protein
MFSIVTVASSTRIPTANARPPKVMMLIVCPSALRAAIEERMAKGIEMAMISVPPTARAIEIDRLGLIRRSVCFLPESLPPSDTFQSAAAFVSEGAAAFLDASAARTRGATRVPSSSIARISLACGRAATLI